MNQSNRIATLLFLYSRKETSLEEEHELFEWRQKSPTNEQTFRELGDREYVQKMMADLYKGREVVYDNLKVRFSYLSDTKLSEADDLEEDGRRNDFPEKDIAESGLSKSAFWEALLSDIDFSKVAIETESNKQNDSLKAVKPLSSRKRKPRRLIRVLMYTAAAMAALVIINYFTIDKRYQNYKAEMVSSDGIKTMLDDFNRGFEAGKAGITFDKTDKGEPIYIAANEHKAKKDKTYSLHTAPGGEFILKLPDGTMIWMNAASRITYPANFDQDTIRIEVEGEVYIQKSKDSTHYILISRLTVNGQLPTIQLQPSSILNINSYTGNDELTVTLIQGEASVKLDTTKNKIPLANGKQAAIILNMITVVHDVDSTEIIAWKNGQFDYKDVSLTIMMPAIANWYDLDIQYASQIPDKNFSLRMPRSTPISEVLDSLRKQGLHITHQGKTITIWK